VRRSGALPGDLICVTGALGGSLLSGRHLSFSPRIREALLLAEQFDIHAMIDVSDGLSTDLLHIAQESAVGLEVEAAKIPLHPDALAARSPSRRTAGGRKAAVRRALEDGEDYELAFCTCERDAKKASRGGVLGTPVTVIGRVTEGPSSHLVLPDGRRQRLRGKGWEHLRA